MKEPRLKNLGIEMRGGGKLKLSFGGSLGSEMIRRSVKSGREGALGKGQVRMWKCVLSFKRGGDENSSKKMG